MSAYAKLFPFILAMLFCLCNCTRVDIPEEVAEAQKTLPNRIDFNLHVKPILSDRCFACHGPDKNTREEDLRLDIPEGAFAALKSGNGKAIVPGSLRKSALVHRILSPDPDLRMPPLNSNLSLSPEETAILLKWIEQGAGYKPHWAFIPPEKPEVPPVTDPQWTVRSPIDNFVLANLANKGLAPSPEADKERLLRRVTLDLTGLPPTVAEMDAFLNDSSPDAYEKVVDRLLRTDAYAERMAMEWMDVARYADSHGMHADGWRMMWPWRDWVIRAFKENMPYDQFGTWQIAGDLLPDATRDQILATAFNRNHPMTAEGGVIDEEFRLQYVFDRTNTVGTAFLALTMECARCHDHKFDPVSQKDYYAMSAFFNNVKELGMTGDDGNYGPMLLLPDSTLERRLTGLQAKIEAKERELRQVAENLDQIHQFILTSISREKTGGMIAHLPFDKITSKTEQIVSKTRKDTRKVLLIDGSPNCTSLGNPESVPGKFGNALRFTGEYDMVHLEKVGNFEMNEAFSVSMWIHTGKTEAGKTQVLIGNAGTKNSFWRGWDFFLDSLNHLSVRLIHSLPHNYLQVSSRQPIRPDTWTQVAFTYDGSGKASGVNLFINGEKAASRPDFDRLTKTIKTIRDDNHKVVDRPLRIGKSYRAFTGEYGIFRGMMDEVQLFNRRLSELEMGAVAGVAVNPSDEQLREYTLARNPEYGKIQQELKTLREQKMRGMNQVPEVMVMEEMPSPRQTFVLSRGQYDAPTEAVEPNTPGSVLHFPDSLPKNRLGLARWIFDPQNPLTARVTVNRYWQLFFGEGLVKTSHDFGNQGNLPAHPELLDWLAVTFRESGWDVRALLKLIATSATYRQSSNAGKELLARDPDNQLLARGPRHRLSAEMIRDNALAASGLLVKQVGGASVKPYQPEGLWTEKNNFSHMLFDYVPSKGDSLYRRSMYSFIRRTSPHPAMIAFDATNRDVCLVKRETTNTPLQALILLNDPQFVEAARVMAVRVQKEGGQELENQLRLAFRLSTGRKPKSAEVQLLTELFESQYAGFRKSPARANELLGVGEYPQEKGLDNARTAALAIVASTLLNHDESYTKR